MDIEKSIKNCEIYLKQIKQYEPEPYYVNHFFNEYINSVNDTLNGNLSRTMEKIDYS